MCYTDDQGLENEHCKPCLVGARWDKLREQLGSSYVRGNRTTVPVVKYGTWLSSTLMGNVFRILLKVSASRMHYDRSRELLLAAIEVSQVGRSPRCMPMSAYQ